MYSLLKVKTTSLSVAVFLVLSVANLEAQEPSIEGMC